MSPELSCFCGREDNPAEMKSHQLVFSHLPLPVTILHMLNSISISRSLRGTGAKASSASKSEDIANISEVIGAIILSTLYDFFCKHG